MSRSRRQLILLAVGVFPWTISGCGDAGALDGLVAGKAGRVTAVTRGDQLEIDGGEVVRLAGVEAPGPDELYGAEAMAALTRLVSGDRVELLFGGARTDPYGRVTAHLRTYSARRWVQGALLDAGAARVRTYADNRALARPMLAREAAARRARRGLWALAAYRVRLPEEVEPGERGLILVEGRVVKVGRLPSGDVYLDFGQDYHTTVSALIPRGAVGDFRRAGLDPLDLEGRLVRVRGVLGGLRLVLDHPELLEPIHG